MNDNIKKLPNNLLENNGNIRLLHEQQQSIHQLETNIFNEYTKDIISNEILCDYCRKYVNKVCNLCNFIKENIKIHDNNNFEKYLYTIDNHKTKLINEVQTFKESITTFFKNRINTNNLCECKEKISNFVWYFLSIVKNTNKILLLIS